MLAVHVSEYVMNGVPCHRPTASSGRPVLERVSGYESGVTYTHIVSVVQLVDHKDE